MDKCNRDSLRSLVKKILGGEVTFYRANTRLIFFVSRLTWGFY